MVESATQFNNAFELDNCTSFVLPRFSQTKTVSYEGEVYCDNVPEDNVDFASANYGRTIRHSLVEVVPDMEEDKMIRLRAGRFIGTCIVGKEIEQLDTKESADDKIESLHDAINKAIDGNLNAKNMVETNVRTDIFERTVKAGLIIKVNLSVDESGDIHQYGQSIESVHANSLRFGSNIWQMRERTEAETLNAFRIEQLYRQEKLDEYYFVVFSRAPDNMNKQQMSEVGFFTDTMTCVIQATTAEDGILTTESAFVAGTKSPTKERHDECTIVDVSKQFGFNLEGKSATEILAMPILIPKSLMPNGVIDLVKIYDECAGGTFFGEDSPQQDYLEYKNICQERQKFLQPKVESITKELLESAPKINDHASAAQMLSKISEKHMVEQAAFDNSINSKVFGLVASLHIEEARLQFMEGNYNKGVESIFKAKQTAVSNSCPSGLINNQNSNDNKSNASDSTVNYDGDCEFVSKECPVCHEKNVKTTVKALKSGKKIISGSCGCAVIK